MPLSIVTPTRGRWYWLAKQAEALAPQLAPDDTWIIAVDNDRPDQETVQHINDLLGYQRLIWLTLTYPQRRVPRGCVNRARNAATAMAPADDAIVEVDDHDILEPNALDDIRGALKAGDYVFANFHQQALIDVPSGGRMLETWPDVTHRYYKGAFADRTIEAIGVRAFKRWLWTKLGGWSKSVWPGGDYDFAYRAEQAAARIVCLNTPLCTVMNDADSLSGEYRSKAPNEQQAEKAAA